MSSALNLTTEQVLALAPDVSASAAARKLATPAPWRGFGKSERAIWGECQGSAVYQVRLDLSDHAVKCSCPSRKFPCKHGLALMLLAASGTDFKEGPEPEWVASWLATRGAAAARKQARRDDEEIPPEKAAEAAKRSAKRGARVREGLEAFDVFLSDIVRNGLAGLEREAPSFWERQAARLVDAQAPGLASRLRRLATIPGAAADWPSLALEELGRLALCVEANRRLDDLEAPLREDVRQLIGFTVAQEDVLSGGETVADRWAVAGQRVEDSEKIRVQRTWLAGEESGRTALVLQFAAGGAPLVPAAVPGTRVEAELAFWPSAFPVRAMFKARQGPATPLNALPGEGSIGSLCEQVASVLARQPFADRFLALLKSVVPVHLGDRRLGLADSSGRALPLTKATHHRLLALSGGHPVDVTAEWDGHQLAPMGILSDGVFHLCGGDV